MADQPLILIVDDEAVFTEIFSTKLSAEGFRIETASNGNDGLEKAKASKPDLVLLDVKMPGLSGAEILLKLKEDPATKDIKAVFLTSLGDPRSEAPGVQEVQRKFSQELGATEYIRKTDDLDSIVDRVKALLKK